jgi:hypothetical protein
MFVVIRTFRNVRSVPQAVQRAETGIGQIMKKSPGFLSYHVFGSDDGTCGSITTFTDAASAAEANEKALVWIRASLADLIDGEPSVVTGDILVSLISEASSCPHTGRTSA